VIYYFEEKNRDFICGFSDRNGGFSLGPYGSFNLGQNTEDNPEYIQQNINKLASLLNSLPENLVFMDQVHGVQVLDIDNQKLQACDAIISKNPKKVLIGQSADCPIGAFYDLKTGLKAIAHSGWRGTANNIFSKTILEICKKGAIPENIKVAIGPSICQNCFEVGSDVSDYIPEEILNQAFIKKNEDKGYLNLKVWLLYQLDLVGIKEENIELSEYCSFCDNNFYSYRRDGKKTGRQVVFLK